eukprot:TRINITY_DN9950_c0_g1_i1.p1 TRINITY_DN9950_c0_g1~~TRINITY_DN9950_c0_g1_i1.p1  ORF type:complete len:192 (+),score=40.45 TRINITY_DN9950_c0_g1_i1:34-576(+)
MVRVLQHAAAKSSTQEVFGNLQTHYATIAARQPRHRSALKRQKQLATAGDDGALPEWVVEDQPVWLKALLRFLEEPDLLVVNVGSASLSRSSRKSLSSSPSLAAEELRISSHELRKWAQSELAEALSSGSSVRPIAVFGDCPDQASSAVEVLRSIGLSRIANLRTHAFLNQLQTIRREKR